MEKFLHMQPPSFRPSTLQTYPLFEYIVLNERNLLLAINILIFICL